MPASVAAPKAADDRNATRPLCPLASISDATVNPSGILCKKIAIKIIPPSHVETSKSGRDRDPVEKSVDHQAKQSCVARVRVRHLIVVSLFPKMKMRSHRMLEKMHQEISGQKKNEDGVCIAEENGRMILLQLHRFGEHFDERRRQHESGTQRDEIL